VIEKLIYYKRKHNLPAGTGIKGVEGDNTGVHAFFFVVWSTYQKSGGKGVIFAIQNCFYIFSGETSIF